MSEVFFLPGGDQSQSQSHPNHPPPPPPPQSIGFMLRVASIKSCAMVAADRRGRGRERTESNYLG